MTSVTTGEPVTIGVTIGRTPADRYSVHHGYVDVLWSLGAVPLVLAGTPASEASFEALATHLDGLLVTGGGDVAPASYGEIPRIELMDVDSARDAFEIAAVSWARSAGIPVLGICRGIQVVAVSHGGSLMQDLPSAGCPGHWEEEREHEPVHGIRVAPNSLLSDVLGPVREVNSIHHQAVADPGPKLSAVAWAPDGTIEAVEGPGILGVQWHPERLVSGDPRHAGCFSWLVDAARAARVSGCEVKASATA